MDTTGRQAGTHGSPCPYRPVRPQIQKPQCSRNKAVENDANPGESGGLCYCSRADVGASLRNVVQAIATVFAATKAVVCGTIFSGRTSSLRPHSGGGQPQDEETLCSGSSRCVAAISRRRIQFFTYLTNRLDPASVGRKANSFCCGPATRHRSRETKRVSLADASSARPPTPAAS